MWEEKLEGEVQQPTQRCGVKPQGKPSVLLQGNCLVKLALRNSTRSDSVRTEVCSNCQTKRTGPGAGIRGSGNRRGSDDGAGHWGSGCARRVALRRAGLPGEESPGGPEKPGPAGEVAGRGTFGVPGAGRPPWSPPAALICEANLGPRRQVLNCLYESHAGLPMTTLR